MFKQKFLDPIWLFAYLVLIALLLGGGYIFLVRDTVPSFEIRQVLRGDITNTVRFTGTVVPVEKVDLGFELNGRVTGVYAVVGDRVFRGSIIATLENGDTRAKLNQARADKEVAEANLRKLERGTREEEINVGKIKVENAQLALTDAQVNLHDTIQNSINIVEDVINDDVDQLFTNSDGINPSVIFITDYQSKLNIEGSRLQMQKILSDWQISVSTITNENVENFLSGTRNILRETAALLAHTSIALINAIPSAIASQSIINTWIGEIGIARGSIDSASSNLSKSEEKLNIAQSNLELAKIELVLITAGTTEEEIEAQKATVRSKEALVALYENDITKSSIRSPIRGIVSEKKIEVGELVTANTKQFSVITLDAFEIEASVSELDIARIKRNDPASVTLDAYSPLEIFEAFVIHIDPAETVLNNVPTYGVTLQFFENDPRIRSGMTANVSVLTDVRKDVLQIPAHFLESEGDRVFVKVLHNGEIEKVFVQTGLHGIDDSTEIITGLKEGDTLVVE